LATCRLFQGILCHLISEESLGSGYQPFNSETRSWLHQASEEFTEAKVLLEVLDLRDRICRHIGTGTLTGVRPLLSNVSDSGPLGTPVAMQYCKLILQIMTTTLSDMQYQDVQETFRDTVQSQTNANVSEFANVVAELVRDSPDGLPLSSSKVLQLDRRVALAFALAGYKRYRVAITLLQSCSTSLSELGLCNTIEFGFISAELVKCLNAVGTEDAACVQAVAALTKLQSSGVPPHRYDRLCLSIALADAYIGQAVYDRAQQLLNDILAKTDSQSFETLRCVTALRLNKVNRRNGSENALKLGPTSPIWVAVESLKGASEDVYAETIQELISVRSQLQPQAAGRDLQTVRDLVDATRRSLHEKCSQPTESVMAQLADLEVYVSALNVEELHHAVLPDSTKSQPRRNRTTIDELYGLKSASQVEFEDDEHPLPLHSGDGGKLKTPPSEISHRMVSLDSYPQPLTWTNTDITQNRM
jgi:hypothetical protein